MKKILFLSSFPPNRKTAGQNYSRQLLDELSDVYNVDLIYFSYKEHESEINDNINIIKVIQLSVISKLLNSFKLIFIHPFFTVRFNFKLLYYLYRNCDKYDILYFDFSQVFIYSIFIKHKNKVFMAHDVIYQKYTRSHTLLNNLLLPFLKYSEKKLLKSASKIFCFSHKDQNLITEYFRCKAIPVSFYIDKIIDEYSYNDLKIENSYILYGAWNRIENREGLQWFINEVSPNLPNIKIKILGSSLPDNIKQKIDGNSNIEYLGFVENPYIELMKSKALIAPVFKGAGVKVKVIEALATGTPVIGTSIAFEGIDDKYKNELIEFKTCDDLIDLLLNKPVSKNSEEKEKLKSYFKDNYGKDMLINKLF